MRLCSRRGNTICLSYLIHNKNEYSYNILKTFSAQQNRIGCCGNILKMFMLFGYGITLVRWHNVIDRYYFGLLSSVGCCGASGSDWHRWRSA